MKICILSNGYGTTDRGAERFTEGIYDMLKNDYEIKILSTNSTGTKTRDKFRIPWRNGRAYLEAYYFGKRLYNNCFVTYFVNFDTDLVINNAGFVGSYWCNKIRKLTDIPFITLEKGGGREERINHLFKPDKMVYLTKHSMDKSKYKKKAHLPIGINVSDYQKKQKIHPFMKDLERPVYLSTSALVKFKRIPLIIDAVSKLDKGTLLQTSDGAQKQEICEYGLKMLGDRFQYAGKVSRDVLLSLYQHSDCFVSASEHEAFGIVYLEAMASGLPVVTQMDERRKEIIGNGGHLVDCNDKFWLSVYIQSYKADRLKPLEQAKKFDWKVLKPRYVELIEEVDG